MSDLFDKNVMFENISYLLKEKNMRVGEFEAEAGVSPGYISRTSKDEKTKPGIDFIVNASSILGVGIDSLLFSNYSNLTSTDKYIISFLEKLNKDTINEKLSWNRESAESLNRARDGYPELSHPLFSYNEFYEETIGGDEEYQKAVVFLSHSFEAHTYINGDCFNISMKNGARLYIMNICKTVRKSNDNEAYAIELWLYDDNKTPQFICRNLRSPQFQQLINDLYSSIVESSSHPQVNSDVKYIIDAFMKDDFSDDELPF